MRAHVADASSSGGTTVDRRPAPAWVTANRMSLAVAAGKSDHSSAIVPVTNGAAALVPEKFLRPPDASRLWTPSPGADTPRNAMEWLRFESGVGLPARSQATTGSTQGWRVMTDPPSAPWFPAATTIIAPRAEA